MRLLASLLLLPVFCGAALSQSAPSQRLADDQHRLAEQTRRLESLLGNLEEIALEEGAEDRAGLLAGARARLLGDSSAEDLVATLERISAELTQGKWGQAVEQQEQALVALESLLEYLLRQQQNERIDSLQDMLLEHAEEILAAVQEQKRILGESQELLKQRMAQASQAQAENSAETDSSQNLKEDDEWAQDQAELAQDQAELAEKLAQQAKANPVPQSQDSSGEAAAKAEEAAEALQETDIPSLEEAIAAQQEVLQALQEAADQAQNDAARLESMQQQEELLDLAAQAQVLLERHAILQAELTLFSETLNGQTADRRQRSQLRTWSKEEAAIAVATQELLDAVQVGGADTTPFFLRGLVEGHHQLSQDLGPPRFRASDLQVGRGQDLLLDWQELIAMIEAEAERERQKIESPSGPNQDAPPPLVSLAEDLQMLKRLQSRLGNQLASFTRRNRAYSEAGIPLDGDDMATMEFLLARQTALRELYEAILARLEEASSPTEEGSSDGEEEEEFF